MGRSRRATNAGRFIDAPNTLRFFAADQSHESASRAQGQTSRSIDSVIVTTDQARRTVGKTTMKE